MVRYPLMKLAKIYALVLCLFKDSGWIQLAQLLKEEPGLIHYNSHERDFEEIQFNFLNLYLEEPVIIILDLKSKYFLDLFA